MTQVLLAPANQRNYGLSIREFVEFEKRSLSAALTDEQLRRLRELHPTGQANFWGAIPRHRVAMERLRPGDPVVFTGEKLIRSFGEVGFVFENERFADTLWGRHGTGASFTFVYTVLNVRVLDRPISDLWAVDGFTSGDFVFSQRLVTGARAERLIDAFHLNTSRVEAAVQERLAVISAALHTGSVIVPPEARHTDIFFQRSAEREEQRRRVESQLVEHYRRAHPDRAFNGFITPDGRRTDLYRADGQDVEIIEAKAGTEHEKVRQAGAQLLDYAPFSPAPVTRLTALFPAEPGPVGMAFLHRLGIDCIYRTDDGRYRRDEAPSARRRHMYPVWRGEWPT